MADLRGLYLVSLLPLLHLSTEQVQYFTWLDREPDIVDGRIVVSSPDETMSGAFHVLPDGSFHVLLKLNQVSNVQYHETTNKSHFV